MEDKLYISDNQCFFWIWDVEWRLIFRRGLGIFDKRKYCVLQI